MRSYHSVCDVSPVLTRVEEELEEVPSVVILDGGDHVAVQQAVVSKDGCRAHDICRLCFAFFAPLCWFPQVCCTQVPAFQAEELPPPHMSAVRAVHHEGVATVALAAPFGGHVGPDVRVAELVGLHRAGEFVEGEHNRAVWLPVGRVALADLLVWCAAIVDAANLIGTSFGGAAESRARLWAV